MPCLARHGPWQRRRTGHSRSTRMSRVSLQTRPLIESIPAEAVNRWTHGLGFAISLPAVAVLLAAAFRNGDMWVAISFLVYGVAMVGLYASSTLSHGFEDQPAWRQNFRI